MNTEKSSFLRLPLELRYEILKHCSADVKTLARLEQTSKQLDSDINSGENAEGVDTSVWARTLAPELKKHTPTFYAPLSAALLPPGTAKSKCRAIPAVIAHTIQMQEREMRLAWMNMYNDFMYGL